MAYFITACIRSSTATTLPNLIVCALFDVSCIQSWYGPNTNWCVIHAERWYGPNTVYFKPTISARVNIWNIKLFYTNISRKPLIQNGTKCNSLYFLWVCEPRPKEVWLIREFLRGTTHNPRLIMEFLRGNTHNPRLIREFLRGNQHNPRLIREFLRGNTHKTRLIREFLRGNTRNPRFISQELLGKRCVGKMSIDYSGEPQT